MHGALQSREIASVCALHGANMGPSTARAQGEPLPELYSLRVSHCGRMHRVTTLTSLAQIYSPQEGRGIGLVAKISAYALQV